MARTLIVLLALCGAGCSATKTTVVSRLTVEPSLPHTSYRPDVKAKLEVELKREY